ncbi:hypothetical protein EZV62_007424 [Acer yangbiense]|uniref:Uncharacterized protein n=1 Tax=Acer yangbiense TaxID=1000413 RepID=A0A5C7IBL2_9ROSI|nr:hypothetical protein EZV62_007424 [Acer yangbiense]
MDGFAISIAVKVAEYLVGPIVHPFSANQIIDEASIVIEDNKKANTKCCKGLCPNPKKRFQLSKQVANKAEAVAGVHEVGKFGQVVSYCTVPEETWLPSIKGYEAFDSRIPTLNNVLDALSDPDANMVGVYGMGGIGGIGKTTLAKEVARQAKEGTLFKVDEVVFVEVFEKPDLEKIQGAIVDKLGLVFTEVSESGRARKLCERLKKEKSILIVLDNIWRSIDLETVGIPYGDNHKGCKLLLTARSRDVLSNQMSSQKTFSIDVLNAEDAWSLFKKTVGACIEQHELQSVAVDVAKSCGGMPNAIVTTAKALRKKRVCEWNNALRQLTSPSPENFEGVTAEAYLRVVGAFLYKDIVRNMLIALSVNLKGVVGVFLCKDIVRNMLIALSINLEGTFQVGDTIKIRVVGAFLCKDIVRNILIALSINLKGTFQVGDTIKVIVGAFLCKDIVRNMLIALSINLKGTFQAGDTIKAGKIDGEVIEMGLLSITLLAMPDIYNGD